MSAKNRVQGRCQICREKNVQVQIIEFGLGQNSPKLGLRIASKHTVAVLGELLSKCYRKCPSPNPKCPSPNPADTLKQYLKFKGYDMAAKVELVWLPLARIAELNGKSIKTIRRMIAEGSLIAVKRTVKGDKSHTCKSFILAQPDIIEQDRRFCLKHGLVPEHLQPELMTIGSDSYTCLFIVSYNKQQAVGHGQD